jgi:hypothetical protein
MLVVLEVRLGVRGRTRFGVRIASRPNAGRAPPTIASRWPLAPRFARSDWRLFWRGGAACLPPGVARPPPTTLRLRRSRSSFETCHRHVFVRCANHSSTPQGEGWCPILHASLFVTLRRCWNAASGGSGATAQRSGASRDPPVVASRRRRMTGWLRAAHDSSFSRRVASECCLRLSSCSSPTAEAEGAAGARSSAFRLLLCGARSSARRGDFATLRPGTSLRPPSRIAPACPRYNRGRIGAADLKPDARQTSGELDGPAGGRPHTRAASPRGGATSKKRRNIRPSLTLRRSSLETGHRPVSFAYANRSSPLTGVRSTNGRHRLAPLRERGRCGIWGRFGGRG